MPHCTIAPVYCVRSGADVGMLAGTCASLCARCLWLRMCSAERSARCSSIAIVLLVRACDDSTCDMMLLLTPPCRTDRASGTCATVCAGRHLHLPLLPAHLLEVPVEVPVAVTVAVTVAVMVATLQQDRTVLRCWHKHGGCGRA